MEVLTPQPCRPLVEVLQGIEDHRHAKGLRYPLSALLNLCCAGVLCSCRTYSEIAQWGRECSSELARELGFLVTTTSGTERRPSASTLFYTLRDLDRDDLEYHLGAWMEEMLANQPLAPETLDAVALDGKTLRGSAKAVKARAVDASSDPQDGGRHDMPGMHLLSAFSQRWGVTLGQCAVSDKGNEITATPDLLRGLMLRGLMLEGRVLTMDAMFTQRTIAEASAEKGGTM
jgi:hypothetical protein